jgi:RNA polymerase sigma-70 factor, ECF subfamily
MGIEREEVASFAPVHLPDIGRLEYLYATSQRRLVIEMAAFTGDVAAAEDLVQEAFGRCVSRWAIVAGYDDPEAWVRSVAYNLARSRWRRLKRGARAIARLRHGETQSDGPDSENIGLMIAISKLDENERQVVVRHYLLDQPVAVVGAQLGIPEGTVKSRLARARTQLAETLKQGETEGGCHA